MPKMKGEKVNVNWMDVSEYPKGVLWELYIHHTRMSQFFLEKFMGMDKPKRGPAKGVKYGPRKKKTSKAKTKPAE